jgi:hypothetical protein
MQGVYCTCFTRTSSQLSTNANPLFCLLRPSFAKYHSKTLQVITAASLGVLVAENKFEQQEEEVP